MTYVILSTRYWYGPEETKSLLMEDDDLHVMIFLSRNDAISYIATLEEESYDLSHNEVTRADYVARTVKSLPAYLRAFV